MKQVSSTEPELRRHRKARRPIHRIALLSPTSGNLGNAAMQWAMITNIRKRIADVEILGITLDPEDTRRRLGIESFPLAGAPRAYYAVRSSTDPAAGQQPVVAPGRLKQSLRRIPVLRTVLKSIRALGVELSHIVAAARVVRKLDLVIIPGGSAVNDFWGGAWGHPWILFKWSVLCRVYRVPFMFVSVGKSSLQKPLSRFFLRRALRLAEYRSFRDEVSKAAVETLAGVRNDPVYPDLAFSYPIPVLAASQENRSQDDRLVVGFSPIAYCDPRAWPRKDQQRYENYVRQLAEMVMWLVNERYRVLFFTTDSPDIETVVDIHALLSASGIDGGAVQTLPASTEQSPDNILRGISAAHLTIACRLHGVILSHLNGTPVVSLSFDPKVEAHMNVMGQQKYCLDIEDVRVDTLIERFTALRARREEESAHIRSVASNLRQQLDAQYDRILGIAHSSSVTSDCPSEIEALPISAMGGDRNR
jgi:polysaccharide pyruvyl transferase WcaK-like protein